MTWNRPTPQRVWEAIETYLRIAYPREPSPSVRARLEELRNCSKLPGFFDCPALERDGEHPTQYALRLGSRIYPHMKLVVERAPDGRSHLFRADTHDRHCRPSPESKDYAPYCKMMEQNQQIAREIENGWEAQGLPTFRAFLKADLQRRRAPEA